MGVQLLLPWSCATLVTFFTEHPPCGALVTGPGGERGHLVLSVCLDLSGGYLKNQLAFVLHKVQLSQGQKQVWLWLKGVSQKHSKANEQPQEITVVQTRDMSGVREEIYLQVLHPPSS